MGGRAYAPSPTGHRNTLHRQEIGSALGDSGHNARVRMRAVLASTAHDAPPVIAPGDVRPQDPHNGVALGRQQLGGRSDRVVEVWVMHGGAPW